ncbi:HD family phosphohydrolase [Thioalkalivibrio sp. ALJ24]|uniref:HD family phosphohydrolase n=1 Tax=Thioalkalivibrio sp. ALJ24 TaxID=545276 RepID=UPI000371C2D6|nr:HD family phosphohydrolase [Thioalkalivibrio sp. ALJ24]
MPQTTEHARDALLERVRRLNEIGVALSAERNKPQLLEQILSNARALTGADAGSIYLLEPGRNQLEFALVQNDTLDLHLGGTGDPVDGQLPPVPLYREDGEPNDQAVVVWSVLNDRTALIADAYREQGFDFSGTRAFDQRTGYRTCSVLSVPLRNHEGQVIAALQLLNKTVDGDIRPFDEQDRDLARSLASQAAVALTNQRLIDELRELFDHFVQVIATAIDAKSPSTGAHCRRVPEATLLLAEAASESRDPAVRDFHFGDDDYYELRTAAWLHDCGKVVTPHHVMEKSTKLEGIFDRVDAIGDRLEILARDHEIRQLREALARQTGGKQALQEVDRASAERREALTRDLEFLRRSNTGGEFMTDEDIARIEALANRGWDSLDGNRRPLLDEDEIRNLCIRRGTLNDEERGIMEGHMTVGMQMLEQLPFPAHLRRVPEYALGHHESMDGRGYPRGLTREQLSIPARIMGIADVFEALTAPDRPYKQPMPLSQALTIMGRMVEDGQLDPDLFRVFIDEGVYRRYAEQQLDPRQIDEVDTARLPGLWRD